MVYGYKFKDIKYPYALLKIDRYGAAAVRYGIDGRADSLDLRQKARKIITKLFRHTEAWIEWFHVVMA